MSGEEYQIFMAASAHKKYKKFHPKLQQKVKQESLKMAENPHHYEELRGPLKGIRSYHFEFNKTQYRIAYQIIEDSREIEVLLVKSRENFYQILRRMIK